MFHRSYRVQGHYCPESTKIVGFVNRFVWYNVGQQISGLTKKTMTKAANLFSELPSNLPEELIEKLVDAPDIRIERIVSTGHASPPGYWYDQSESEWVVVLRGEAMLAFEDEVRILKPGDYVLIPAHCKHRVNSTSLTEPTVWLAVFFNGKVK